MNVQETMRSDDQGGPAMMVSNHATLKLLPGMGPRNAHHCFRHLAAAGYRVDSLQSFRPPAATRRAAVSCSAAAATCPGAS